MRSAGAKSGRAGGAIFIRHPKQPLVGKNCKVILVESGKLYFQNRIKRPKLNFMKSIGSFLVIMLISSAAMAQVTKKTLELPEFKSIYNNSSYTVYLKQTNKQEVNVEALTEIFEVTTFSVENGVLLINIERKPENPNKSVWAKIDDIKLNPAQKIYVSVKNIAELQVNGSGKIVSENSLAATNLSLSVGGSGGMDLDIKGDQVKLEVSGSGKIALRGYATNCEAVLSGSGSLNAFDCPLETGKVKVSGSGIAELTVTTTLEALVLGSGSIKHKGNTKNTTKKVYGSGSVDRAY
jgi:Putative auto-transporter adhesin, head GIN domain